MIFSNLRASVPASEMAPSSQALYHCACSACAGSSDDAGQGGSLPGQDLTAVASGGRVDATAALLAGTRWDSGTTGKTVISYSFATAASQYLDQEWMFSASLSAFSAADQATTRAVLKSIEAVCNVQFVEVADSGADAGVVRYAYSAYPNAMGYAGYAFFPDNSTTGGNVWIGAAQASADWAYYRPNLILHETLHAIGLKHPFDGAAVLPAESNTIPNTVMSYSPAAGASSGSLSRYPGEPMELDVLALQALYGAATNNTDNTVYNLADAAFKNFRVLWDTAGTDTLDASACKKAVQLDLASGAHSDVGSSITAYSYFGTGAGRNYVSSSYTDTLTIASGSVIENATGSAYADLLLGNDGDNILSGGSGNDVIDGRGGNDQLFGGKGNDIIRVTIGNKQIDGGDGDDTVAFSGSVNEFSVTQSAGIYTVNRLSNPTSVITLRSVEHLAFSDINVAPQQALNTATTEALTGQAFRLYKAALNRLPDKSGLEFQADALKSGLSLAQLAGNFMASPEFTTRFNVAENSRFVTLLYNNVLGRAPEAPGLQYHLSHLDSELTRAQLLVNFSESPENQAAVVVGVGGVWPTL